MNALPLTNEAGAIFIDPQQDATLLERVFDVCREAGRGDSILRLQPSGHELEAANEHPPQTN